MQNIGKFPVLSVGVHAVTTDRTIALVRERAASGSKGYLVFCTVSTVLNARDNELLQRALDEAALVTPDGMPLVWLGKRAKVGPISRVYGPDFMLDLMSATGGQLRHYFFGGAPGVVEEMVHRLRDRFPDLQVAGLQSPPANLSPTDVRDEDVDRINGANPDIVWIGLGHPKQEIWALNNQGRIRAPVLAAVGAAFDFHAGRKREAPEWMKKSGLQWLHRLLSEPRRLWRRYLVGNTKFVLLLLKDSILKRRESWRR